MYFEVFIPSTDAQGYDVKMTVEADNWMMALKSGLARTGESEDLVRNVMCDIKEDNTIHVTDATSRRVFVLKELPEPSDESQHPTVRIDANKVADAIAASSQGGRVNLPLDHQAAVANALASVQPAAAPPVPAPKLTLPAPKPHIPAPAPTPSVVVDSALHEPVAQQPARQPTPTPRHESWTSEDGRVRIGSATYETLRKDEPQPKVVDEKRFPTGQRTAVEVGRSHERVSDNVMEEVFLEINQIHEGDMSMEQVVNFVMDLSIEKVRAEAGSIMFADVNGKELYFATARGPKAAEVMNFRVPMSKGIAGFCAREGVSLAISDAENDPRFYREISEALGYPTKSMLCAPIQFEGRVFGAIELLNKGNNHFVNAEVNVLKYIGQQLGKYVYDLIMAREKLE